MPRSKNQLITWSLRDLARCCHSTMKQLPPERTSNVESSRSVAARRETTILSVVVAGIVSPCAQPMRSLNARDPAGKNKESSLHCCECRYELHRLSRVARSALGAKRRPARYAARADQQRHPHRRRCSTQGSAIAGRSWLFAIGRSSRSTNRAFMRISCCSDHWPMISSPTCDGVSLPFR